MTTASGNAEPKKLSTRPELTNFDELGLLWAVYNGMDYKITFKSLLDKVTKLRLGLQNVDNTSDEEKPLSKEMRDALALKANGSEVITNDSLNSYKEAVALEFSTLRESLATEFAKYVSAEIENQHYTSVTQLIEALGQQISALQQANTAYATKAALDQLSASFTTTLQQLITARIVPLEQATSTNSGLIQSNITTLNQHLQNVEEFNTALGLRLENIENRLDNAGTGDVRVIAQEW